MFSTVAKIQLLWQRKCEGPNNQRTIWQIEGEPCILSIISKA